MRRSRTILTEPCRVADLLLGEEVFEALCLVRRARRGCPGSSSIELEAVRIAVTLIVVLDDSFRFALFNSGRRQFSLLSLELFTCFSVQKPRLCRPQLGDPGWSIYVRRMLSPPLVEIVQVLVLLLLYLVDGGFFSSRLFKFGPIVPAEAS